MIFITGERLKNTDEFTLKSSYELLNKYKAPRIVIKHSEGAAKVAYMIGKKLEEKGEKIDVKSVVCASLVHDLFKIIEVKDYTKYLSAKEVKQKKECWQNIKERMRTQDHVSAFAKKFGKKYPKTTNLVIKHRYHQVNKGFDSWEEKIVYYADKLVKFDKITTLNKRISDLKKRYSPYFKGAKHQIFVKETNKKIFSLEKEIFKTTGLSQNNLTRLNKISLKKLIKNDFKGEI